MRASVWAALWWCGCGAAELSVEPRDEASGEASEETRQKEQWAAEDSPFLFSPDLETRLAMLPTAGEAAQAPWPGSYWPVAHDSINFKWAGEASESAARKYERAFGATAVEDAVSRVHGIAGAYEQRSCVRDADCDATRTEVCGRRAGHASGRCIPAWWGICHGWAPAAVLWPEPRLPVVRNSVRFEVQDLKALASVVHDRTRTRFVSLRCNSTAPTFAFDHYGRPTDGACRDTNAGTYHLLLANYLGMRRQSFVEDRTIDAEVWNQPLRNFRVVSQREVSVAEANRVVGANGTTWSFNPAARRLIQVVTWVGYVSESDSADGYVGAARIDAFTRRDQYEYVLELDGGGHIIGGEWAKGSQQNHPDFVWLPLGPGAASAAGGTIGYENVKQLVMESAAPAAPIAVPYFGTFEVPQGAWKFLGPFGGSELSVELRGSGDADLYVRAGAPATFALYDCRPFLAHSNEGCAVRAGTATYVAVYGARASTVTLNVRRNQPPLLNVSGAVRAGEMKVHTVNVVAGRTVRLRTTAPGDVDLYARLGSAPTTTTYDARAFTASGNETLDYTAAVTGVLRIGVYGYAASGFQLTAEAR